MVTGENDSDKIKSKSIPGEFSGYYTGQILCGMLFDSERFTILGNSYILSMKNERKIIREDKGGGRMKSYLSLKENTEKWGVYDGGIYINSYYGRIQCTQIIGYHWAILCEIE